jgi:hypothetical protein
MGFLLGDLGMPNMRWIVGRSGRQLLAVCALSLALTAAVLAFGGVALSTLGVAPGPLPAAGSGAAGVFTIVTPTATPTAERRPAAPTTFVIPTRTVTGLEGAHDGDGEDSAIPAEQAHGGTGRRR